MSKMLAPRHHKPEPETKATFPTIKVKNITCVYCSSQFILKNLNDLKRSPVPLLLACGHPFCGQCLKRHEREPCPLCGPTAESSVASTDSHPPANTYVVGLIALRQPSPTYGPEPDMAFSQQQASSKSKSDGSKEDRCYKCGYRAIVRCLDCKALFCQKCYLNDHAEFQMAEKHQTIVLQTCENNSIFEEKKCTIHNEILDYYCDTCCFPSCHHCMILDHNNHAVVLLATKNKQYEEQFLDVQNKIGDAVQRIYQAKKKIQKMLIFPEELQKNESIENAINKHFLHLHGVLQNIERRSIDRLHQQRDSLTKNLEILQERLNVQESQLQSVLTMAITGNDLMTRMDLKDIVSKMEKLAVETQCFLVQDPILSPDNIIFKPDLSIIQALENHCQLEIPKISSYGLHRKDSLPEDYELEPLAVKSNVPIDVSICSEPSIIKNAVSYRSLNSERTETQPEQNGGSLIPVKIAYVENPSNFFVYRVSKIPSIAQLQERLNTCASHNDEEPSEIKQKCLYAVKSSESGKWYRGRVTAINTSAKGSETYEILNLDRGSFERGVRKKQMRCISEPITKLPPMVMRCMMSEVHPRNDGPWSDEACKLISQYQESNETLLMHIKHSSGDIYGVDLVPDNSKGIFGTSASSIRDILIFQGLGVRHTSSHLLRKTPNAVLRLFVEDLTLQWYHEVEVSYAESPHCIYVRKRDDKGVYLQNMMAEMNKFYNDKVRSGYGIIYVPDIGITCAAQDADGQWYRAIIIDEPTKARMVTVTLVDVGRKINVSFDNIRTLHGKFMTGTAQAIKTSVADIKPADGEWSDECLAALAEQLKDPEPRVFPYEKIGDTYTVCFTTSTGISVGASLIAKGFAISTGSRSSGVVEATMAPPKKQVDASKVRNTRAKRRRKNKQAALPKQSSPSVKVSKKIEDPFKVRVEILRVVSPDEIYVADPENETTHKKLVASMQRFYGRYEQHSNDGEWKIDDQCAVYSASDKSYCRAKILGFNNPEEAQVFLYDLTYTENIPVSELQPLKNYFWKTPIYAFKVKLAGVLPCGGSSKWVSASCQTLKNLIAENQNSKFYICKVDNPETDDLQVELWVEQSKIEGPLEPAKIETNSINKLFVASGMALPMRQHEKKPNILAVELKRQISNANEQDPSTRKDMIMNASFRKKERLDETVVPQEIDTDDDSLLSDQNNSSFTGDDDPTMMSVEDSSLNASDTISSDEKIEPTATEWLPAEPIAENQFTAVITNLDHDCRLYFHSISQSRAVLHYIEKTLAEIYNKMDVTPRDLVWEKGDLCIAQYHSDKKWYRGQVHRVLENHMIEVEFIDYGNFEECENGTLRKTLALIDIPRQGALCKVHELVPNTSDGKWKTIDLDRIHGVIVDQECDIKVLKREPDHLVVSLIMLHPKRCELKKFLRNDLKLSVGTNSENSESSDESDEATQTSEDVVIDGYIEDRESELLVEKRPDDQVLVPCIGEDSRPEEKDLEIEEEKNSDESIDHCNENILQMSNEIEDNDSKRTIICDNSDSEPAGNDELAASPVQEHILSGTICFTHNSDGIDANLQENDLDPLDLISLPDELNGFREDELTVSTPYEKSFELHNHIDPVKIPDDVTLVEAEIAVIGVNSFLLQLLGNNSSKMLTHQRRLYEKMMDDMQTYAESQPVLKSLKPGELCCAKYSDGRWYRSKVQSSGSEPYESGHKIQVYFIDFGNQYRVKSKDVRVLREEWFEVPTMLMCCNLWNTFPNSDDSETALEICEFFESQRYTESKQLRRFYIKIESRVGDLYQIQMYNDASCTNLTYQPIIDEGLYLVATDL